MTRQPPHVWEEEPRLAYQRPQLRWRGDEPEEVDGERFVPAGHGHACHGVLDGGRPANTAHGPRRWRRVRAALASQRRNAEDAEPKRPERVTGDLAGVPASIPEHRHAPHAEQP